MNGESEETAELRARMLEMAPVLKTLPKGTHVCCIQEGDGVLLYNVTRAIELTVGREPSAMIDVAARVKLVQPLGSGQLPEDKAQIDPEHAKTVDLSYPILLLEGVDEVDGSPGRVIDGWHRIYRASQLGIAELPAVTITAGEEPLIRINPLEGE